MDIKTEVVDIKNIFLSNLKSITINSYLKLDNNSSYFNLIMEEINQSQIMNNYRKMFIKYLEKKYNRNYKKINIYIIKCFLKKYKVLEVLEIPNKLEDMDIDTCSLIIKLEDNKSINLNVPIKSKDNKINRSIKNFLTEIKYEILKAKSMEAIDESFFDYYMNNEISTLEIKDSIFTNTTDLIKNGKSNKKNLYYMSNKLKDTQEKDIAILIADDFITDNIENVEKISYKDGIKIYYKNGKTFETTNNNLIEQLNAQITKTENTLINKKIKVKKNPQ